MNKIILQLLIITCSFLGGNAQTISIRSITTARQSQGDVGYTLNGIQMTDARAKLLNVNNFGPAGTYPKAITITHSYLTSGSLQSITSAPLSDLFYFGIFNSSNTSLVPFTGAELDSLHAWSVRGGKLIIGSGAPAPATLFTPDILNSRWGFDLALLFPTNIIPTTAGTASTLFTGPFGNVITALQGGSSQGYFTTRPADIVILADDGAGNPTMYLDCATLDLVVADGDVYTSLGNITAGNTITSPNDILWANSIAYMDSLEGPPVISVNGNQLSTGTYNSYQWFLNGNAIPGANASSYIATQPGNYTVQVPLPCGCNSVASQSINIVGENEIKSQSHINIYPNPSGSEGINFDGVTEKLTISALSLDGRLIDTFTIDSQNKHYKAEKMKQGAYFLKIYNNEGKLVSVKNIIRN